VEPKGRTFGGRYELCTLIATGGMGQVWQARDLLLNRDVAVKVLRSEYTGDATFLARFRAEAQLSAGLVHPHIATLFDYGEVQPADGGEHLAYLVMELVRGESLSRLLSREGRLPVGRTLDILRQSAAGLAAAHQAGVVHRDVKPGNVLLGADGRVAITDFGVAMSAASVPLTQTGQVIGTPYYLSPEQAQGGRATPASDVYALGVVGYECLAGRRPFDAETSVQVVLAQIHDAPPPLPDDVPRPVRRLVERALVKDPAARFPDGAAFRNAIEDVLSGHPPAGAGPDARTSVRPDASTSARRDTRTRVLPVVGPTRPRGTAELPPAHLRAAGAAAGPAAPAAGAHRQPDGDPSPAGRRRLLVPLLALLAVAAVVLGAAQFLGGAPSTAGSSAATGASAATTPATTTAAPTTTAAVALVSVPAGDYVGRPVGEVQAELTALGLQVSLQGQQTADVPDGQVTALDRDGRLTRGTAVTVSYAVAPPPTTTAPPPPPATDPGSTTVRATTSGHGGDAGSGGSSDKTKGKGDGKGNGKGKGKP
jgi:serine/threonine-protein kinase